MIRFFGGGPETSPDYSGPPASGFEPLAEAQAEGQPESLVVVPEKLAQEILPSVQYLYKREAEPEYQGFKARRDSDPIAILLDPDRVKTEREEQRIDELVAQKIQEGAVNREGALKILFNEHIYAPLPVQQYFRLIQGLNHQKPVDITFLETKFRERREHEDGIAHQDPRHLPRSRTTPLTKKEIKRAEAERDKMDRFLTELSKLRE